MKTQGFETDKLATSQGELEITFFGHGSLLFRYGGKNVYVDPFSRVADYSKLPKADVIFITHEHRDHLDPGALGAIRTKTTSVVHTVLCEGAIEGGLAMRNGDLAAVQGIGVEAVPAYNMAHVRESGDPFHRCGDGNGYLLTFGDLRVLVAGDTENTPELKAIRDVDVAFLPMNLPYTMTPEMVADAALAIRPKILYPYHFGDTDPSRLVALLHDHPEIEVRIRRLA